MMFRTENLPKIRRKHLTENGMKYLNVTVARYFAKKGYWKPRGDEYSVEELGAMLRNKGVAGRRGQESLNHSFTFGGMAFIRDTFVDKAA